MNRLVLRTMLVGALLVAITLMGVDKIKEWLLLYHQNTEITITSNLANTPQPVVEEIQPLQLSSFLAAKVPKTTGIGTIEVPAADIFLPVFSGLKNEELLIGAGTIFPEREPSKNNLVILGHYVGSQNFLFGSLNQVKVEDSVFLHYLGKNYEYKIVEKKVIDERDIQVMQETKKPELTLLTCGSTNATSNRICVKACLVNAKNSINQSDKTMNKRYLGKPKVPSNQLILSSIGLIFLLILFSWFIWMMTGRKKD